MMTNTDKPAFVAALAELALLKPGASLTEQAYGAWWNAMRERWTLETFRQAAAYLRDTLEFMPNPYHFDQLRKAGKLTAGEAWEEIRRLARAYVEGEPDDPVAAKALRALGGLRSVAMCESDKVHFLERRFAEHFESMQGVQEVREALPQVARDPRLVHEIRHALRKGSVARELTRKGS